MISLLLGLFVLVIVLCIGCAIIGRRRTVTPPLPGDPIDDPVGQFPGQTGMGARPPGYPPGPYPPPGSF